MSLGPLRRTEGKLTLARTHLRLFLFYWAERCIVSSFIKHVRSPKLNPSFLFIENSNYLFSTLMQEKCRPDLLARSRLPRTLFTAFSLSFLTRLQFASSVAVGLFEIESCWFTVKLAEESARYSAPDDQKVKYGTTRSSPRGASLNKVVIQVCTLCQPISERGRSADPRLH